MKTRHWFRYSIEAPTGLDAGASLAVAFDSIALGKRYKTRADSRPGANRLLESK